MHKSDYAIRSELRNKFMWSISSIFGLIDNVFAEWVKPGAYAVVKDEH